MNRAWIGWAWQAGLAEVRMGEVWLGGAGEAGWCMVGRVKEGPAWIYLSPRHHHGAGAFD